MTYESPASADPLGHSTLQPVSNQVFRGLGNLLAILSGSLFVAVFAHITVPLAITPVPLSLQDFAVLALGLLAGPRLVMFTMLAYLAEGAAGLPVFTPGPMGLTGIAHILGPTGGYLMAYPTVAVVTSYLWRNGERSYLGALVSAGAGTLVLLTLGGFWLGLNTHVSIDAVIAQGVMPFLPGDGLKIVLAAFLGYEWSRMCPAPRKPLPTIHASPDLHYPDYSDLL